MGTLVMFDLKDAKDRYDIGIVVETGTGWGHGVIYAIDQGMEVYSMDVDPHTTDALARYKDRKDVHLHLGPSYKILPKILPKIPAAVFWLDAHFPCHISLPEPQKFALAGDPTVRLPLETELRLIAEHPCFKRSIFYIDDLRIYQDGPFQAGSWGERSLKGGDSIEFIFDIFRDTHAVIKIHADQGYVIAVPNQGGSVR